MQRLAEYWFAGFLLLACYVLQSRASQLEAGVCLHRGFSTQLTCSSCMELHQFNLDQLSESCQQCCQPEAESSSAKKIYPYALLIVCECKFGRYPQIEAFVRSQRVKKFPGLEIRYAQGADPVIKLLNENREVEETLGIDRWNTDAVEEFLSERLGKINTG